MAKCYSELIKLPTFEERFEYLKLDGRVGNHIFGSLRYLNQALYHSEEWERVKREIIIRDEGRDLGIEGRELDSHITIHHINPPTIEDYLQRSPCLLDKENLICVSQATHRAIHYGDSNLMILEIKERSPNDMCPWKKAS